MSTETTTATATATATADPTTCCDTSLQSDPEIRRLASSGACTAAVMPVGSTEQHGPHLPVSTDTDIARAVARLVSEKNGYLLLPAIAYGVSYEHAPLFHLSISDDTLCSVIDDACRSIGRDCHVRDIIIINGHHGNMAALEAFERHKAESMPRVHIFHYWRHIDYELGHAGFAETSMMLAISASAVRMDLAEKGLVTDGMSKQKIRELSEIAARSFLEATGNGIWGDPTHATAAEGHRMLEDAAHKISESCRRLVPDGHF